MLQQLVHIITAGLHTVNLRQKWYLGVIFLIVHEVINWIIRKGVIRLLQVSVTEVWKAITLTMIGKL